MIVPMAKTAAPAVTALAARRYLSRSARTRWSRDRVFFQIEELNALVAPLLARQPADKRVERVARARARAAAIRTAAQWTPEPTTAQAWAYLETQIESPEDTFGAADLLRALAPDAQRTRALFADVSPDVSRLIAELCSDG
jgi:hypothetical protein